MNVSLTALKLILRNFAPVIKSNVQGPPSIGVDISREERLNFHSIFFLLYFLYMRDVTCSYWNFFYCTVNVRCDMCHNFLFFFFWGHCRYRKCKLCYGGLMEVRSVMDTKNPMQQQGQIGKKYRELQLLLNQLD